MVAIKSCSFPPLFALQIYKLCPCEPRPFSCTMVVSFSALMRPWLDDLDGLDWLHFCGHRLTSLRYIRDVSIRPELLRAATQFWDPEVHVFRFGLHELCPTVEEFHAYIGGFDLEEPVIPLQGVGFASVLCSKLEISNNAAKSMIRGGFLNISRLIEGFRSNDFAMCLCLLAAFLFVQSDGQASSSLVGVAMQIEERKDVAPMVLAETLMGLDGVHAGRTDVFEGSPLLLQVGFSLSSPFSGFFTRSHFTSALSLKLSKASHLFSLFHTAVVMRQG